MLILYKPFDNRQYGKRIANTNNTHTAHKYQQQPKNCPLQLDICSLILVSFETRDIPNFTDFWCSNLTYWDKAQFKDKENGSISTNSKWKFDQKWIHGQVNLRRMLDVTDWNVAPQRCKQAEADFVYCHYYESPF